MAYGMRKLFFWICLALIASTQSPAAHAHAGSSPYAHAMKLTLTPQDIQLDYQISIPTRHLHKSLGESPEDVLKKVFYGLKVRANDELVRMESLLSPEQSIQLLLTATPDSPPVEALTGTWPRQGHVEPSTAFSRSSRSVSFAFNGPQPGVAILSDSWHPGWTVTVNGKTAVPLRVGGVFRGVVVPAGNQVVVWRFAPWGWTVGLWLFALGIFGLFGLRLLGHRTTPSPPT